MSYGDKPGEGQWEDLTPELSDEELQREIDDGEFYTTEELIQMIKDQQSKRE